MKIFLKSEENKLELVQTLYLAIQISSDNFPIIHGWFVNFIKILYFLCEMSMESLLFLPIGVNVVDRSNQQEMRLKESENSVL